MKCTLPVLVDLVYEDARSPLTQLFAAFTALNFFAFSALGFTPSSCAALRGGGGEADAAGSVFFTLFVLLAALASSRAQSRRLLLPALAAGAVYAALAAAVKLRACDALVRAGAIEPDGIVSVLTTALDFAGALVALWCLGRVAAEDFGAVIGRAPLPGTDAPRPRYAALAAERETEALRGGGGGGGKQPPSAAAQFLADVARGARLAPLRHNLGVLASLTYALAFTASISVLAAVGVDFMLQPPAPGEDNLLPDYVVAALVDGLRAAMAGVVAALVLLACSLAAAYAPLARDVELLAAGGGGGGGESGGESGAEKAAGGSALAEPLRAADGGADGAAAPGGCAACVSEGAPFCADGKTLRLSWAPFSLQRAAPYTFLIVISALTAWALAALLLAAAAFFVSARATRVQAIATAVVLGVTWLYNRAVTWGYKRWIADGDAVHRPRLLVLVDFALAVSAAAATGVSSGLARFALGAGSILLQMTSLARPLAPAFAAYDGGFVSYGSMLKAAAAGK